jgi:hypothetical protein
MECHLVTAAMVAQRQFIDLFSVACTLAEGFRGGQGRKT